ncbi:cobalamin B12-binding domain-containing protein [Yeosuana marina]|uniref:cobalamin B12-binding domain-containing protein n=1 Tax=Yeosuana marina TaxID=1565536 RepID=UPI00142043D4|nr:cobalamin-dependent protein [Yeosuana marina]
MLTIRLKDKKQEFLKLLLVGNKAGCSQLIRELFENKIPFKHIYEEVLKSSLYDIGELWESNKISVGTEHLASAIVESILNEGYSSIISSDKSQKKVLLCCVENEFHQIGIKMVGTMFESLGWDTFFLGTNMPTKDLIDFAKITSPDIISISVSLYFHLPLLETLIENIRREFPDTTILVGGLAFRHGGQELITKYSNIIHLKDLNSIELFIHNYK